MEICSRGTKSQTQDPPSQTEDGAPSAFLWVVEVRFVALRIVIQSEVLPNLSSWPPAAAPLDALSTRLIQLRNRHEAPRSRKKKKGKERCRPKGTALRKHKITKTKRGGLPCGSASLGWLGTGRIKSPVATRKGKKQIPHDFTRDDNVGGGGMTVWVGCAKAGSVLI